MINPAIKERIWELDKHPDFTQVVFKNNEWLLSEINSNNYGYAHVIYIDNNRPYLIIGTLLPKANSVELGYSKNFSQYLKYFDTNHFKDILFALDSYWINNAFIISYTNNVEFNFKPHPIIDDFLSESRGVLLWHHQLENLFLFYDNDREKAVEFRKNILMKKADAFELARKIKIDSELTAEDVINERMLVSGTITPSFKEAVKLFKYLNKG